LKRYDNWLLQLARQSGHPPARSTVLIYEAPYGGLEIRYRDRVMRWTEVTGRPAKVARPAPLVPPPPGASRVIRLKPPRACDDHPWRRGVDQHRLDQQVAADRKAYAAVTP
jgi:hypothetical protein